jgi:hypothetical protein
MSDQNAIVVQQPGFLAPVIGVQQALEAYQAKKDLIDGIMKKDVDFGTIPGSAKPSLLKAGAEKATSFFGLHPVFVDAEVINDWTGQDHGGEPFFFYRRTCNLYRGDTLIASVDGSCNSWEVKYRYRWVDESALPSGTDKSTLKSQGGRVSEFSFAIEKAETSGQYGKPAEHWKRFVDAIEQGTAAFVKRKTKSGKEMDAWEIDSAVYRIKNFDTADVANTVLKMADKRALVAATLIATGLSEYFTQDIEDYVTGEFTDITEPVKTPGKSSYANMQPNSSDIFDNEQGDGEQRQKAKPERPYQPEALKKALAYKINNSNITGAPSDKQIALLASMLDTCFAGEDKASDIRHSVTEYLTGYKSVKDMPGAVIKVLLDWLDVKQDSGGEYQPNVMAVKEAHAIRVQALKDAGQMDLLDTTKDLGGVQK